MPPAITALGVSAKYAAPVMLTVEPSDQVNPSRGTTGKWPGTR